MGPQAEAREKARAGDNGVGGAAGEESQGGSEERQQRLEVRDGGTEAGRWGRQMEPGAEREARQRAVSQRKKLEDQEVVEAKAGRQRGPRVWRERGKVAMWRWR